jgi:hypothetical protein
MRNFVIPNILKTSAVFFRITNAYTLAHPQNPVFVPSLPPCTPKAGQQVGFSAHAFNFLR